MNIEASGLGQWQASSADRPPLTSFWLGAWALALSLAWLLPNHYLPWSSFHMDVWISVVLSLACVAVIARSAKPVEWRGLPIVGALVACVPALQYGFGMLSYAGTAWVSTTFLIGFLLTVLMGSRWESGCPGQVADGLFLAIGAAAIVSVGLQLHQWFRFDTLEVWVMPDNYDRPFANLGQPNQLATLLLWALLALLWGHIRSRIGGVVAIGAALYLLFGLALTASRTSWVAIALLVGAAWFWKRLWRDSRLPWVVAGLAAYFAVWVMFANDLHQLLMGRPLADLEELTRVTMASENRPALWLMFLDAAWQRPWFGYGWNQVVLAQLEVAVQHTAKLGLFSHSHNLFLDLMLWCGIPLGGLISAFLLWWIWDRLRSVQSAENAVLALLLLVIANHAMLELPLHYAYFLLPVGLVVGALDVRLGVRPVILGRRWVITVLWLGSIALLSLVVRDYARVESAYQTLRFEWARVKTVPAKPPEVLLLTQWRDFVRMAKFEPNSGLSDADLKWMRDIAGLYPSSGFVLNLSQTLALNQRPQEALVWLQRVCQVTPPKQCVAAKAEWTRRAQADPKLAAVPWPR